MVSAGDAVQALTFAQRARGLAEASECTDQLAESLYLIGFCCWSKADYDIATFATRESIRLYEELGDDVGRAKSLNTIGLIYWQLGDLSTALGNYTESYRLLKSHNEEAREAAVLNNIGIIYRQLGQPQDAMKYYEQALAIRETLNDKAAIATSLNSIGVIHFDLKNYRNALACFEDSLALRRDAGADQSEASSLCNIGETYFQLGELEKAADYFHRACTKAARHGDANSEAVCLQNLAAIDMQRKKFKAAVQQLTTALNLASAHFIKPLEFKIHEALAEAYAAAQNFEKAFEHYKKFFALRAEVLTEESAENARKMQRRFDLERAESEAERQRIEAEVYRLKNVALVKANAELTEANMMKSELLSIAAHDLRNPLTAILNFSDMLSSKESNEGRKEIYVNLIGDLSRQMLHIIKQLLNTTAIESGKIALNRRRIDLAQLTSLMVDSYQPRADQKQQTLELRTGLGCMAWADEDRMMEVLDNLISNAMKYSLEGQTIWIAVSRSADEDAEETVCIEIKDEGQGMTEDDLKKAFGKFQRLSARPTGKETSTGLGLAIVKRLVELHGGNVRVASEGKDKGCTFTIELPASI